MSIVSTCKKFYSQIHKILAIDKIVGTLNSSKNVGATAL